MSIESERTQRIEAHIKSNPDCNTGRFHRIEIEGKVKDLPIFRLPTKFFAFNIENGRFAADLKTFEAQHNRRLDPLKKEDAKEVQKILIEKYPSETKRLRGDLQGVGQLEPGVSTAAGILINGNRRMAILVDLFEKTADDKFSYIEAVILPPHINATEIYKIEARLQYARDFKVAYGPVNELLKIKEGVDKDMSVVELARLLGQDVKYIEEHLEQLKLLEEFSKYRWGSVDYRKIEAEGITEAVTDVVKNLKKFRNEGMSAAEIKKLIEIQFAYIKSGATYADIRRVGKINGFETARSRLFSVLAEQKNGKLSDDSFKERIEDIVEEARIKAKKQKPAEKIHQILSDLQGFRDEGFSVSAESRKDLLAIARLVDELTRKGSKRAPKA